MDEASFWQRMNPARLHALYDAWFALEDAEQRAHEPPEPARPKPERKRKSLFEYLSGG